MIQEFHPMSSKLTFLGCKRHLLSSWYWCGGPRASLPPTSYPLPGSLFGPLWCLELRRLLSDARTTLLRVSPSVCSLSHSPPPLPVSLFSPTVCSSPDTLLVLCPTLEWPWCLSVQAPPSPITFLSACGRRSNSWVSFVLCAASCQDLQPSGSSSKATSSDDFHWRLWQELSFCPSLTPFAASDNSAWKRESKILKFGHW